MAFHMKHRGRRHLTIDLTTLTRQTWTFSATYSMVTTVTASLLQPLLLTALDREFRRVQRRGHRVAARRFYRQKNIQMRIMRIRTKMEIWTSSLCGNFMSFHPMAGNKFNVILNISISSPSPWKRIIHVMTAAIPIGLISWVTWVKERAFVVAHFAADSFNEFLVTRSFQYQR